MNVPGDISGGKDGTGTEGVGIIRLVDGELYVDEVPFARMLDQFLDRYAEFKFFFPATAPAVYQTCDKNILPLVKALNAKGVRTFSSCEGHLQERYGLLVSRPFVWVHLEDFRKSGLAIPEGWELSASDMSLVSLDDPQCKDWKIASLQPKAMAENQEELEKLQVVALELAAKLGQ